MVSRDSPPLPNNRDTFFQNHPLYNIRDIRLPINITRTIFSSVLGPRQQLQPKGPYFTDSMFRGLQELIGHFFGLQHPAQEIPESIFALGDPDVSMIRLIGDSIGDGPVLSYNRDALEVKAIHFIFLISPVFIMQPHVQPRHPIFLLWIFIPPIFRDPNLARAFVEAHKFHIGINLKPSCTHPPPTLTFEVNIAQEPMKKHCAAIHHLFWPIGQIFGQAQRPYSPSGQHIDAVGLCLVQPPSFTHSGGQATSRPAQ